MKSKLWWAVLGSVLVFTGAAVAQDKKPPEVRRIVTGLDASGKAIIMFDSAMSLTSFRSPNPAGEMWVTPSSPPDYSWTDDRAKIKVPLVPPDGGTIFRIVDFVPLNPDAAKKMDINLMMKVVGDHAPKKGQPPKHPMMHRTRSLDYAIIMSGEIDMMMDDKIVHLKAGDVVVQQATNHAWINRGTEVCRIAFILMDGKEP